MKPPSDYLPGCLFNGFGLMFLLAPQPSFFLTPTSVPVPSPISAYFAQADAYVKVAMLEDKHLNQFLKDKEDRNQLELKLS
jgi:hypothetical protein